MGCAHINAGDADDVDDDDAGGGGDDDDDDDDDDAHPLFFIHTPFRATLLSEQPPLYCRPTGERVHAGAKDGKTYFQYGSFCVFVMD